MNILLMVTVLLLMLTLMTTAKLETFRSTQILDQFFNRYMQVEERGYTNKVAENVYKTTIMTKSEGTPKTNTKVNAIPRLSLSQISDKKMQKENPSEWNQNVVLLKKLTDVLYGDHPFYKEFLEKHPNAIDELTAKLSKSINALEKNNQLKNAASLANLPLGSADYDAFFYKMLLGAPYKDLIEKKPVGEEEDTGEDEETLKKEDAEFTSPEGYYSLLDFISMQPVTKIRVYLAPKELLQAIFNDPDVVNEIINKRQDLYKEATKANEDEVKGLSITFKSLFDSFVDPKIDKNRLDFTVNKTNPKEYAPTPAAK